MKEMKECPLPILAFLLSQSRVQLCEFSFTLKLSSRPLGDTRSAASTLSAQSSAPVREARQASFQSTKTSKRKEVLECPRKRKANSLLYNSKPHNIFTKIFTTAFSIILWIQSKDIEMTHHDMRLPPGWVFRPVERSHHPKCLWPGGAGKGEKICFKQRGPFLRSKYERSSLAIWKAKGWRMKY